MDLSKTPLERSKDRLTNMLRVKAPSALLSHFAFDVMAKTHGGKYRALWHQLKYELTLDISVKYDGLKFKLWIFYQQKIRRLSQMDISRKLDLVKRCAACQQEFEMIDGNICGECFEFYCDGCDEFHDCNFEVMEA